jgi:hypothetical protein
MSDQRSGHTPHSEFSAHTTHYTWGEAWYRGPHHRPKVCQGACLCGSTEQFIHPDETEIIVGVRFSTYHHGIDEVVVAKSQLVEGSIGALIKRLFKSAGGRVD